MPEYHSMYLSIHDMYGYPEVQRGAIVQIRLATVAVFQMCYRIQETSKHLYVEP
jgi:hypothetical protein